MTVYLSAKSSRGSALKHEIYFTERGAVVHEFYLVKPGHLRPQRTDWLLVGELQDEDEYDEFIDFCEQHIGPNNRVRVPHVRYSWANWKKYQRKKRTPRAR